MDDTVDDADDGVEGMWGLEADVGVMNRREGEGVAMEMSLVVDDVLAIDTLFKFIGVDGGCATSTNWVFQPFTALITLLSKRSYAASSTVLRV
jgi:hypothetical protein